ncbi:hypothetical protein GUJ93_ZPchr0014g46753 [Zizania palustris]|uniref:Uncharacterized protein n=1 Tax=Zizania palustris TaxID=103762 RepID=A0A8J5W6Y6_ZIZPA|nr:hypothetical protein GUJ93_ZPchr0014g46753 [Zizania palustris]
MVFPSISSDAGRCCDVKVKRYTAARRQHNVASSRSSSVLPCHRPHSPHAPPGHNLCPRLLTGRPRPAATSFQNHLHGRLHGPSNPALALRCFAPL